MDELLKAYPKGVRHVFKQFPLTQIHPHAMNAAKASIAAGKQGKFWEMHDILFQNFRRLEPENVKKYAEEIGLDVARFERDLNSPQTATQIAEDMALARSAEVRGTPTFFVNGKRLRNRSMAGFEAVINPLLRK